MSGDTSAWIAIVTFTNSKHHMRLRGKYNSLDDTHLCLLITQNDQLAFEELYRRYSSVLYVFIHVYVDEDEMVNDMLQDVFMAIWERRTIIPPSINIKAYLYATAKNHMLNYIRTERTARRYVETQIYENRSQKAVQPDEIVERDEIRCWVNQTLSKIQNKNELQIIELRQQGLSSQEVAQRLNISENTVRMYYSRSMRQLRKQLSKRFNL